jgi:hypothetical protein
MGGIGRPVRIGVLLSLLRTPDTYNLFHSFLGQDTSKDPRLNRDFRYGPITAPVTASTEPPRPVGQLELVPHQPPAAALQDRRAADPACTVLHAPASRELLDAAPLRQILGRIERLTWHPT